MEELGLREVVLYTTRPRRCDEIDGKEYFFVDEERRQEFAAQGKLIESRSYRTIHGIWTYFTADDGQIDLKKGNYIAIGTLESYKKLRDYYGNGVVCPIYIEVEDGERLTRALRREKKEKTPRYAEMCRRFLSDSEDFSEEKIRLAGIERRFENVVLEECLEEIVDYIREETPEK